MGVARGFALLRATAADILFDRIELGDPAQDLGGDRRSGCLMELIELASGVGPAYRQDDLSVANSYSRGDREFE